MPSPNWQSMFIPHVSPIEIVVRGSIMYLTLFVMLRVILKRQSGTFSLTDLLLLVLIADAAQNGMAGEYQSMPDGLLLVATLIFWNFVLDYLGQRSKLMERFILPPPLRLVEDGRMLWKNMRKEFITEAELMSHLREQGIDSVSSVKAAFVEGDGQISVIRKENGGDQQPPPRDKGGI